jgi:hypothetical protein
MSNEIDDLFEDSTFVTTPSVARFARLSEAQTRAMAADLDVAKAGAAYVWSPTDVEALLDQLDDDSSEVGGSGNGGDDDDDFDDRGPDEDDPDLDDAVESEEQ